MAVVAYTTARTTGGVTYVPTPAGKHPTARLRTSAGLVLDLPYAPRGATLGGWADTWETVERPGRDPLTIRTGGGLPTLSLSVFLGHADHQQTIEPLLAELRKIAESADRVTLVNLSVQERGPWRLESVTPTIELRQHGTNHATRATVELGFIAANNANVKLGPVAGSKGAGGKGGKPRKGESRYTVRKGDTLAKIAGKELGDPSEWKRIATRNNIKRPDSIKPGDVLIIPADKK